MADALTARQAREIEYHRGRARKFNYLTEEPVSLDVLKNPRRRWWNPYWSVYSLVPAHDWTDKRVLVPGCGTGEDAIRLAALGAEVYAFDLSPELVKIAQSRARHHPSLHVHFDIMPAEALSYATAFFDAVLFLDMLHHVDVAKAVAEAQRVLKPGALIIGNEPFTHSLLQRVRESSLVEQFFYPRLRRFIYGTDSPYITDDERKINETELSLVLAPIDRPRILYFNFIAGRLLPKRWRWVEQADRLLLRAIGPLGKYVAGRVIFTGPICSTAGVALPPTCPGSLTNR
jgi:SAM-dependent methyltransferase